MTCDDIFSTDQVAAFKRIVLAHLLTLDDDVWYGFRHHDALMEDRWIDAEGANLDLTREGLVERYVSSCNMPASAVRAVRGEWLSVGDVEGQPVLFNGRAGSYVWSSDPDAGHTLQIWLSHPAMPKGW